jgi:hypothetical protein
MAKRPRNICDNEIEELVFDCDSEEQCATDVSENESTNDLSEDTDDSIIENEEWHEKIRHSYITSVHCSYSWIDSWCCT